MEKVWDELKKIEAHAEKIRNEAQNKAKTLTSLAHQEAEKLIENGKTYAKEEAEQYFAIANEEANRSRDEKLKANQQGYGKTDAASRKTLRTSLNSNSKCIARGNQNLSQTTLYASVLARIGAERGKLLSEEKLKALTESKNLQEFVAQLHENSYQEQIAKLPMPLTSRKLERAFNENLIAVIAKIIKNSPKHAEKYLQMYLYKFEIENVKTLIKATNASLATEQKMAKLYLSAEDYLKNRPIIEEAAKAQTIKQIVNLLKRTEYGLALKHGASKLR